MAPAICVPRVRSAWAAHRDMPRQQRMQEAQGFEGVPIANFATHRRRMPVPDVYAREPPVGPANRSSRIVLG